MAFHLIRGAFHPGIGIPDGDSVRFAADDISLWDRLEGRVDDPGLRDTLQLRFEGIDAIEKNAIQPLASSARDSMLQLIGAAEISDTPRGYILTRRADGNGRPIAFAFAGDPPEPDGASVHLDVQRLRSSVNYLQVREGYAYPLYYNTLFKDLRRGFDEAVEEARQNDRGYWPTDATLTGVHINARIQLPHIPPIWPKLWRRLEEYLRTPRPMSGFKDFIRNTGERVDHLQTFEVSRLDHFIEVQGDTVRMTEDPKLLRVQSAI